MDQQRGSGGSLRRRTVLIVDDDSDAVDLLSSVLELAGFRTMIANDGEEAINLYRVNHPDAVLMDFLMPGMDGLTALDEIHKFDRQARVAMVTGICKKSFVQEALEAGARDIILKPF